MNYLRNKLPIIIFLALILFSVKTASAATFYPKINNANISAGDIVFIEFMMNTEGQLINVVEGDLLIQSGAENIEIKDFSLAGSDMKFWPRSPSLDLKENKISFAGGVPGGVNKENARLFKVAIVAKSPGQLLLAPFNMKAYLNDGKATPVGININNLKVSITQATATPVDELSDIVINDTKKPQNLTANIGRDDSLFDGKRFLTFSAIDNESGIDYYAVKEGNRALVRSGSIYVLQNQDKLEPVIVVAYDKAGNSRKILIRQKENNLVNYSWYSLLIIVLILVSVLIIKILLKIFKRKK